MTTRRFMICLLCVPLMGKVLAGNPDYRSPESVPGATTVDAVEAKRLFDEGTAFVDVRNPRLFARRHVPRAIHLDLKDHYTEENLSAALRKDQPFVVYCSGVKCSRSHRAVARALKWGFTEVYYFRGGIVDWRDAGYPMDSLARPSS